MVFKAKAEEIRPDLLRNFLLEVFISKKFVQCNLQKNVIRP
jgi:hypothetical protein